CSAAARRAAFQRLRGLRAATGCYAPLAGPRSDGGRGSRSLPVPNAAELIEANRQANLPILADEADGLAPAAYRPGRWGGESDSWATWNLLSTSKRWVIPLRARRPGLRSVVGVTTFARALSSRSDPRAGRFVHGMSCTSRCPSSPLSAAASSSFR